MRILDPNEAPRKQSGLTPPEKKIKNQNTPKKGIEFRGRTRHQVPTETTPDCPGITWAVIDSLKTRKAETQRKRALNRSLKIILTRKKRNRKGQKLQFLWPFNLLF